MGIDHCRLDVLMAEKNLNRPDIVPVLQQIRGEGMPKRVAADASDETSLTHRPSRVGCSELLATTIVKPKILR